MNERSLATAILEAWETSSADSSGSSDSLKRTLETLPDRGETEMETLWLNLTRARVLKKMGRERDELELLATAAESPVAPAGLALTVAQELMRIGRHENAVPWLERMLRLTEEVNGLNACLAFMSPFKSVDPNKHAKLIAAVIDVSQYAKGVCHRETVVLRAWQHLGCCLEHMERVDEALMAYSTAVKLAESKAPYRKEALSALSGQARLLFQQEQYERISKLLIEFGPDDIDEESLAGIMGVSLHMTGRPREAIRYFERALILNPSDAASHFNFARCLWSQELHDEAREHYAAVLRDAGVDERIREECEKALNEESPS